jgi:hypothetical protein
MKPDEIQLLAFVNGELPARERDAIEQAVRASPDVADAKRTMTKGAEAPLFLTG